MACGPLTLKNLRDSWGHGPVGEYGLLVATLAGVGLYSSWSVVEQNILAFADYLMKIG